MAPTPPDRSTFLTVGEVIDRTRRYAQRAHGILLQDLRERASDDRTRLFLEEVEQRRSELEAALDRSLRAAGEATLRTPAQYTVDPWEGEPIPPQRPSVEEATRWILDLDHRLIETYRELAERHESEPVREFFASVVDVVQSFDRQLSRGAQQAYDV